MKTLFAGLFLSFALLAPTALQAQQPSDIELENAKNLFAQAQEAYNAGNYEQALKFYGAAYNLAKKPTILFNIGQCHRKLGHSKEAADNYRQFLKDDPKTPYKGEVEYRIAELEEELGNKREALNYYQLYLQDRLDTDTNEANAKARVAILEKEVSALVVTEPTSKPMEDPVTDPSSDGKIKRLLKQPMGKVAFVTGITSFALGTISLSKKINCKFLVENADRVGACDADAFNVMKAEAIVADVLLLATVATVVLTLKKDKESPKTTSLQFVPTTTGGFVTFSFTPQP